MGFGKIMPLTTLSKLVKVAKKTLPAAISSGSMTKVGISGVAKSALNNTLQNIGAVPRNKTSTTSAITAGNTVGSTGANKAARNRSRGMQNNVGMQEAQAGNVGSVNTNMVNAELQNDDLLGIYNKGT